jgi:hypothetical protein
MSESVREEQMCKEYTALRMMELIANRTGEPEEVKKKDYWLKLYRQCYKAVCGSNQESILEES